ncbi:LRP chaperone MESD-like [Pomacea canaliculata]|uniref:LRP chaperone MESD-like n=1 Tax=Pomacea canaliculata TaxID=400727 RepID=UPI000D7342D2|nr:LRP chaperone MESD-like [Pomacea canaliculata]
MGSRLRCLLILLVVLQVVLSQKKDDLKEKRDEKWKKKDVRDYSDADVERLYDQWEETDDDELEPDELPEWKREPPPVDMSKLNPENPEEFLKLSKKGRTQMMFATVAGNPTERETETISSLWHSSLYNANIETQRFVSWR